MTDTQPYARRELTRISRRSHVSILRLVVPLGLVACTLAAGVPLDLSAQASDLDQLMERVVSTRDDNWARMRQYVLDERETLRVIGPSGAPIYGFERDYSWFIREGFFIRSPLRADGVTIDEAERRSYETEWIRRERERLADEQATVADERGEQDREPASPQAALDAVLDPSLQPRFVSAAYFLELEFDPGQYAFVGRETLDGHEVLRIEYYPTRLFEEGRTKPNRRVSEREKEIEARLNKATVVTLWVDPEVEQIRRYRAENLDWSFLPGRSLVRVDEIVASMSMQEAFPGVWLPDAIEMRFGLAFAFGDVTGQYRVQYHDYRLADVTTTIRPGRER